MISFDLTDEQQLLEQSVREWAAREIAPHIKEDDRQHRFDRDRVLGGMAKLGLLGISVPQQYGGAGMDYVCLGIASEELEYVDTSLRVIMSVHAGLNCLTLLSWGTEDQKQRYLVPQAQGQKICRLRSHRARRRQRRARDSDDRGEAGRPVRAERREDRGSRSPMSPITFWSSPGRISRRRSSAIRPASAPSSWSARSRDFRAGPMKEKWGILAGNTGWFKMDDVEVPEENLVGRPGEGFKIAMFALDQGRFTVAAGATGLIRACRDASVKYAKERHDVRRRDRTAPAREGNDRADGVGLSGGATAVAAIGLAEESGAPQHA